MTAYIMDTGIRTSHGEFSGRARNVWTYTGDPYNGDDCHGHGTHVAATVGGYWYGVAKQVQLRGLKVYDCTGNNPGGVARVLDAIEWLIPNHVNPAVVNMSFSYTRWDALDQAVTNLANSGVFVAVAAGNNAADACAMSPARAYGAFAVGATAKYDVKAAYSNYGPCVDAFAPGDAILSASIQSGWYAEQKNGTSMASPHVAGVAALYKQAYGNASWITIRDWLKRNATQYAVTLAGTGSPNLLLYKGGL